MIDHEIASCVIAIHYDFVGYHPLVLSIIVGLLIDLCSSSRFSIRFTHVSDRWGYEYLVMLMSRMLSKLRFIVITINHY